MSFVEKYPLINEETIAEAIEQSGHIESSLFLDAWGTKH